MIKSVIIWCFIAECDEHKFPIHSEYDCPAAIMQIEEKNPKRDKKIIQCKEVEWKKTFIEP